jgi:thiamine pyrophosphate-dependent acetolactate synthase large subunit-like protein
VDTIFGLPGGGINGVMEALRNRGKIAVTLLADRVRELV